MAYTPPPCAASSSMEIGTSISVTKTFISPATSSLSSLQSSSSLVVNAPSSIPKPSFNLPPSPDMDSDVTKPIVLNSTSKISSTSVPLRDIMSDNDQGQSTKYGIPFALSIVGGMLAFVMAIFIITVAVSVSICLKVKRANREPIGAPTANQRMVFPGKKSTYRVTSEIGMELNEAYVSSANTSEKPDKTTAPAVIDKDKFVHIYTNPAAVTIAGGVQMKRNEAYATSIITERNKAYAVSTVTKKNENDYQL